MIQRIQTIYLALVAVLSILGLCLPIGKFYQGTHTVATYNNFVLIPSEDYGQAFSTINLGPIALGVLLIIVALITLMSIMLYRHRMRQLRLTIFSTILLVGYVAYYAFLTWKYTLAVNPDTTYHLRIAAVLPVVSIILNCLAIHGIRRDEALVRSLDRLR